MVNQKQLPRTLNVLMNGICVGQLKKTTDNQLNFRYSKNWLNTPAARPISLSMPLLSNTYTGEAVFNFFDALLPARAKTRARIQAQFKTNSSHPFDLLQVVGKECVGALQFVSGRIPAPHHKIRYEILGEKGIANRLSDIEKHPLGMSPLLDTFSLTLPGTSEKAAFLYHDNTWARPRDKTPTTHILKLARQTNPYQAENAWLCSAITKAFGLPVAETHLMHFGHTQALVTKRFDRRYSADGSWIMRLPQETIAQALGLAATTTYSLHEIKYFKRTMQFLLGSANPIYDRDLLFCAHVLYTLLQSDTHCLNNLSVFILPEGKYRLTPLYDIHSAHLTPAHQLPRINKQALLKTAKLANYSVERANMIIHDMLSRLDGVIAEVSAELPPHFPKNVSIGIFKGMQTLRNTLMGQAASAPVKDVAYAD